MCILINRWPYNTPRNTHTHIHTHTATEGGKGREGTKVWSVLDVGYSEPKNGKVS